MSPADLLKTAASLREHAHGLILQAQRLEALADPNPVATQKKGPSLIKHPITGRILGGPKDSRKRQS